MGEERGASPTPLFSLFLKKKSLFSSLLFLSPSLSTRLFSLYLSFAFAAENWAPPIHLLCISRIEAHRQPAMLAAVSGTKAQRVEKAAPFCLVFNATSNFFFAHDDRTNSTNLFPASQNSPQGSLLSAAGRRAVKAHRDSSVLTRRSGGELVFSAQIGEANRNSTEQKPLSLRRRRLSPLIFFSTSFNSKKKKQALHELLRDSSDPALLPPPPPRQALPPPPRAAASQRGPRSPLASPTEPLSPRSAPDLTRFSCTTTTPTSASTWCRCCSR